MSQEQYENVASGGVDLAEWSCLPRDIYVTSVKSIDGIGFDVRCCSVPMVTVPEVRYRMVANSPGMNGQREECVRRGLDPDEICADGGVTAEMVVAKETDAGCGRAVIEPWQTPAPCGGRAGNDTDLPPFGESANDQGEVCAFKWFDHECRAEGCQSLVWKGRYEAAVKGRSDFRNAYKAERNKVAALETRLAALSRQIAG